MNALTIELLMGNMYTHEQMLHFARSGGDISTLVEEELHSGEDPLVLFLRLYLKRLPETIRPSHQDIELMCRADMTSIKAIMSDLLNQQNGARRETLKRYLELQIDVLRGYSPRDLR